MDLNELRSRIDEIDNEMVELYKKRLDTVAEIGAYKRANNLPVYDGERERKLLNKVSELAGEKHENGVRAMFSLLMEQSRTQQMLANGPKSVLGETISQAVRDTEPLFPPKAMVACQGVEGAYSQIACEKLFQAPSIMYCRTFESVFGAIESGLCRYGILPIENSLAGSVTSVYDQMIRHHFYIVRSTRIKIDHTLLALPGVKLQDIKEVYSHEQAINQCSEFLNRHREWRVNICSNTATAAKMVRESGRRDIAAISSSNCALLYGLARVEDDIQNNSNNHTRFICISKRLEIYPGADHTSLMLVLPNRPGSLWQLLSCFYAQNINLTKLESRPMPGRDFEFMFYFDIEASVYSPAFERLIAELDAKLDSFSYLGSYLEQA
ncbi:MAG: chorismate mutase [Clostridiales bacterium]|nr:chorismate mutase [Clostridiales bacterium]